MTTYYIRLTEQLYFDADPMDEPATLDFGNAVLFQNKASARYIKAMLLQDWPKAEIFEIVRVEVQPEPAKADVHEDLSLYIREVWRALPEEFHRSGELPADVAKLARAYENECRVRGAVGDRLAAMEADFNRVQAENARLKAQIAARPAPEPVADEEIRRVLDLMQAGLSTVHTWNNVDNQTLQHWRDTLQAVGAEVVVARESLEQVAEERDRYKGQHRVQLADNGKLSAMVREIKVDLATVTKERDEARAEADAWRKLANERLDRAIKAKRKVSKLIASARLMAASAEKLAEGEE